MTMKQFEGDGKRYHGAIGGLIWTPDIADGVFETWDYGHAFAYLFRRFGPSQLGSDPHKDLTSYTLTTSMKGVLLTVRPATSAKTSFGYLTTAKICRKLSLEDLHARWLKMKGCDFRVSRRKTIECVLKQAMEELKRPTNVRDWLINIQGRADNIGQDHVEPSSLAGFGITMDYFDKFKEEDDG